MNDELFVRVHRSGRDGNGPPVEHTTVLYTNTPLCRRCHEPRGKHKDNRCQRCGVHNERKVRPA